MGMCVGLKNGEESGRLLHFVFYLFAVVDVVTSVQLLIVNMPINNNNGNIGNGGFLTFC